MNTVLIIAGAASGSLLGAVIGLFVGLAMDEPGTDLPGMACLFTVPAGAGIGGVVAAVATGSALAS